MDDSCTRTGVLRAAEQLVLDNIRGCLTGCNLFECTPWELNFQTFLVQLGPHAAKLLVPELYLWALALRQLQTQGSAARADFLRQLTTRCAGSFAALGVELQPIPAEAVILAVNIYGAETPPPHLLN